MHRRAFIKTTSVTALSLLSGCKSTVVLYQPKVTRNSLAIEMSAFNGRSVILVSYQKTAIGLAKLAEDSYVATLLNCTHMGCGVAKGDGNYVCPCHGARFDYKGAVIKGPAKENLKTFPTKLQGGDVVILTGTSTS